MTLIEALNSGKWFTGPFGSGRYKFDLVNGHCTAEFEKVGTDRYNFSPQEIFSTKWQLERCKHEPKIDLFEQKSNFGKLEWLLQTNFCKHCGVKIKAEKWVEA